MSDETRENLIESLLSSPTSELLPLEFPVNFERFLEEKTCRNVSDWMFESLQSASVKDDDFNHLSADGGSNAIGSIQEWEVVSREEGGGRAAAVEFNVCLSHQNERSGGYASGALKFAENPNEELGVVLNKNHELHVRLNRHPGRMKVYRGVQTMNERVPHVGPDPAAESRWGGEFLSFL